MPRYVAFLRAINVGGRTVTMEALRAQFEALGFLQVETFIASGNVIFTAPSSSAAALQRRIEIGLEQALGYEVATFLRTDAELQAVAGSPPFDEAARRQAGAFNVAFLAQPLDAAQVAQLMRLQTPIDVFEVQGREVYWLCKFRQSESKFSNAVFERALKVQATFRNFNTVAKLAAKYPPVG
ncbi:MAG: DUF1697 domain-containing protein [Burkholderiaceae bacterium]